MADDASNTPPADAKAPEGVKDASGYNSGWIQRLEGQPLTDAQAWAEEYHQTRIKPMEVELHGLRTENGRLKKASDPDMVARLGDHQAVLEDMKETATSLYSVTSEDMKDTTTLGELRNLLRGMAKAKAVGGNQSGANIDPAIQEAFSAVNTSRGVYGKTDVVREALPAGSGANIMPPKTQFTPEEVAAMSREEYLANRQYIVR
jgi:hypothetical protein